MRNVIVTGASGFIGSNLTLRLIEKGCRVHLLLRPRSKAWRIRDIQKNVTCHSVDFLDKNRLLKIFHKIKPHTIFNLAAYGAYSYQKEFKMMLQTNTLAAFNLIECACKTGFAAFVQVGSSSEYGFKDHAPKENELIEPNSDYALTKSWATTLARHMALAQKANIVILRPYTIFGPYEEPTRFIPTLIIKGFEGKLPPLVAGNIARDYVYVDDFVNACLLAAGRPSRHRGEIYNVGSGIQTSIKEAVRIAKKILPIKEKPRWGSMPHRTWDTTIWIADAQKIKKDLAWVPKNSFEAGFKKTVEWFRKNPRLWNYYRQKIQ